MFCENEETYSALNALLSVVRTGSRPLVVWLGAGVSAWAGYPRWVELADQMHRRFGREVPEYDRKVGTALLSEARYPELFQTMRACDTALYFFCLANAFGHRVPTPVYERLLKLLARLTPTRILTTNVDELLERNLSGTETIQRSDVERIPQLLTSSVGFVAKLHGSVSAVQTMVFSEQDYEEIKTDAPFLNALRSTIQLSTVLFLGYGLRDQHVISALRESADTHPQFGTGPHFIVVPEDSATVPDFVRPISYQPESGDHRSALLTLEVVADAMAEPRPAMVESPPDVSEKPAGESICFIGDLMPWGKYTTSQTVRIAAALGEEELPVGDKELLVGEGYVDGELVLHDYSALHDVVVGLICFDVVFLSIDHLARLHNLLGAAWFWRFVDAEAIRLVAPPDEPAVLFEEPGALVGRLETFQLHSSSSTMDSIKPRTVSERIRLSLTAIPGRETEAERHMKFLESTTVDLTHAVTTEQLTAKARSAMMHPPIRRLLGISDGTPLGTVPRWLSFPVIRLAGVIRKGVICQNINAISTRMILGSETLASTAFPASSGVEWADDAASYALTGQFNSNLGALIEQQPDLLEGVLRFRESPAGMEFRREIAERLKTNEGGEVTAAVNAGLRESLPMSRLQAARDQFSGLFMPRAAGPRLQPAVWGDLRNGEVRIARWRKTSRKMLDDLCRTNRYGPYDRCPCGSGEKIKFCCGEALR